MLSKNVKGICTVISAVLTHIVSKNNDNIFYLKDIRKCLHLVKY